MSCEEGKLQLNKKRHFKVKRLEVKTFQSKEIRRRKEAENRIPQYSRNMHCNKSTVCKQAKKYDDSQAQKSGVYGIMDKSDDSHLKNDSLFQNIFIKYEAQRTRKQRMICKFYHAEELMYP